MMQMRLRQNFEKPREENGSETNGVAVSESVKGSKLSEVHQLPLELPLVGDSDFGDAKNTKSTCNSEKNRPTASWAFMRSRVVTIISCTFLCMYVTLLRHGLFFAIEKHHFQNLYHVPQQTTSSTFATDGIQSIGSNNTIPDNLDFEKHYNSYQENDSTRSIGPSIVTKHAVPFKRDRSIIYVHIGKTGGTTLDKVLHSNCEWYKDDARNKCLKGLTSKQIYLSQITKQTFHLWRPVIRTKAVTNSTSFLFTIRNPITRIISAFNMEHIDNIDTSWLKNAPMGQEEALKLKQIFYYDCFPTIQHLALILAKKQEAHYFSTGSQRHDCFELGRKAITGEGNIRSAHILSHHYGHHLVNNYRWYIFHTIEKYPEQEILVIRTEKLWEDIEKLNVALGGQRDDIDEDLKHYAYTYDSKEKSVTSGLTQMGKKYICCYLSDENIIFENILKDAVNIDELEKIQYAEELYKDCGILVPPPPTNNDDNATHTYEYVPFAWNEWKKDNCNFDIIS
jgi:hypothetical protein